MSDTSLEGAVCIPNITGWGRKRRTRAGVIQLVVAALLFAGLVATASPWYLRLIVFLPLAGAALALLQVRRNT